MIESENQGGHWLANPGLPGKWPFGSRAFSTAVLQIWNHMCTAVRVSPSLDSFKHHLKTHYFLLQ